MGSKDINPDCPVLGFATWSPCGRFLVGDDEKEKRPTLRIFSFEPGDKPQLLEISALILAFNADSVETSAIDIGIRNLEPFIFYAFRALNLVSESNTSQSYSSSTDSASRKKKKTACTGRSSSSNDHWTFGISVWLPDQHPATNATKSTVLRSIHTCNCIKLFTNKTRDFRFYQMAVSPDANFVIAQHGTFISSIFGRFGVDGLVTLYRFIPNQSPQFLEIAVRANEFVAGMFHWTRDSRFCLWQFEHAGNSVCALELIRSNDKTDVFKHHSLSLPDEHRMMFINDVINSSDGRYFLIVRYRSYDFQSDPFAYDPLVALGIFELQTQPSTNSSPRISPLLRIHFTNAIGKARLDDYLAFNCELGIVHFYLWERDLEDASAMSLSPTEAHEVNSFSLPIGALDSNNRFLHLNLSSSTPLVEATSRIRCCTERDYIVANPRGCTWAYEKYTICTKRSIIRRVGNSNKRTMITIPRYTWARLGRLRSLPTTGQHVPTLLQLARAALYERPELLHSLECRKDVPPTLLKTCLSLDPLTYMPRT